MCIDTNKIKNITGNILSLNIIKSEDHLPHVGTPLNVYCIQYIIVKIL